MNIALRLASRHLGLVAPNPSVACLIVKNGQIKGRGITASGGRPHAETIALQQAGKDAKGATAYVTLEPCCHHGKTPPCTDALIQAGIKEIIIAVMDPHTEVRGKGIVRLRQAGIAVITGIESERAREINRGFLKVQEQGLPLVTLKLATYEDGTIATQWITSEEARDYAHLLRAKHDAIMAGSGTILQDNPALTCRLPGLQHRSPIRIIVTGTRHIPEDAVVIKTAGETPTWIAVQKDTTYSYPPSVKVIRTEKSDIGFLLQQLAKNGITRILAEGGLTLATSLLQKHLVDQCIWIQSPKTQIPEPVTGNIHDLLKKTKKDLTHSFFRGPDKIQIFKITK